MMRMGFAIAAGIVVGILAGCGGPAAGDGGTDAGACTPFAIERLCVRGIATVTGEEFTETVPVQFQIYPEGCHSSACTVVEEASCTVTIAGTDLTLEGSFCLRYEGKCTLPDCGGGGTAECNSDNALAAGDYTVTDGTLNVPFTVPSVVPFGGVCAP